MLVVFQPLGRPLEDSLQDCFLGIYVLWVDAGVPVPRKLLWGGSK